MSTRAAATALVLLGAVMSSLGGSAVTAAFPVLATTFGASPAEIAWVAVSNTLVSAALLTVFGRLADLHGRKRPYALGIVVYLLGSALCGFAWSVPSLVAFRIVQAVGGALVSANSLAYLVEIWPPDRRGSLVGWWEACIAVGQASGPVVGGLLLGAFGWPAIFFANAPICLAMLALIPRYMAETHRPGGGPRPRFDFAGAGLFAAGLGLLLYGLIEAAGRGWTSPAVPPALAFGVLCAVLFVVVERRTAAPMVDLGMFASAGFSAGNAAKVCAYLAFSANGILMPFYLYRALGLGPADVGLALTLFPAGMFLSSLVAGPLSDRVGTRLLAPFGVLVQTAAALGLAFVPPAGGVPLAALGMLGGGLGIGTFIAPNDSAILSVTPPARLGVANGIMGVSRQLGLILGQAAAGGVLTARLAANGGEFLPSFHETYLVVAALTALGVVLSAVRGGGAGALSTSPG